MAAALVGSLSLAGQPIVASPNIDFRSFTYPFPSAEFLPVSSEMKWMSLNEKHTVALVNGRYDFDKSDPVYGPSIILDRVLYGHLTSANQLDAVVVLGYHTGGTAWWDYVYAFSLETGTPKPVGWFRAGSRADFGLYDVSLSNGRLTVELLDPRHRAGDCCSAGFVQMNYDFRNGVFVESGPREFGDVPAVRSQP